MRIHVEFDVPTPPRRRSRRLLAFAALGLALVLPSVALASHIFTDVPIGHTFHGNIGALAESGVTAGCSPTTYCPDEPVTRGQMAAFLNRGLGRVTRGDFPVQTIPTVANGLFDTFSITPGIPGGAIDGATMFVEAHATMTIVLTDETGCPCVYRANIRADGEYINERVVDVVAYGEGEPVTLTVIGAGPVTGTGPVTVEVQLFRTSGSGTAQAYGTGVASVHAFGGTGGNTIFDQVSAPAGADDGTRPD